MQTNANAATMLMQITQQQATPPQQPNFQQRKYLQQQQLNTATAETSTETTATAKTTTTSTKSSKHRIRLRKMQRLLMLLRPLRDDDAIAAAAANDDDAAAATKDDVKQQKACAGTATTTVATTTTTLSLLSSASALLTTNSACNQLNCTATTTTTTTATTTNTANNSISRQQQQEHTQQQTAQKQQQQQHYRQGRSAQSRCIHLITKAAAATTKTTTSNFSSCCSGSRKRCNNLLFAISLVTLMLLATLNIQIANAADTLLGDLQSCSNEGEEFPINAIKNAKCYKCSCQNGFVNCDKESCPSIQDCYLLDPQSPDSCCQRCIGCTFQGQHYASGMEWTDPYDPCRTYKCVSSVVTETIQKCYTQCDGNQILPPSPGECCPRCQGCKINGQLVEEGQEVVGSIDDRCLVCQCSGQNLTCAKKTCPILQCPVSKQTRAANECCPHCQEQRTLMQLSGKCIYNSNVYYNKTQFTPDRCTNCTCINGTTVCQRATCPILECSPKYQEMDGCCPRCIVSEVSSECILNGTTYQNNEIWNRSPCISCRCTNGNIRCSEMRCPMIGKCRPNEEIKVTAGECCPKCVPTAGTCTVFGDPHFKTFDGKFFSFQGPCKYLLAADCRDHTFSIRLTNDARGTKRSSWAKTVTLKLKDFRITLGQKLRVKVNGSRVILPYTHTDSLFNITRSAETIFLETHLGLNIEWDGNNFLQVVAPASYKRKLCGLCGNFNGYVLDDLTSRDGSNYTEVWRFANSWKVGGAKACSRVREGIAQEPTCKRRLHAYCQPLNKSEVFGYCKERLNPMNYIESCKMDVCECPSRMCHCDSFAAYAHECRRIGVQLDDWRAKTNCPAGVWRRNSTAMAAILRDNQFIYGETGGVFSNFGDGKLRHGGGLGLGGGVSSSASSGGGSSSNSIYHGFTQRKNRKRKLPKNRRQQQQQQKQEDFITRHVPKNLLIVSRKADSTPPPLH